MILYHGTSYSRYKRILKAGAITPRGRRKSIWDDNPSHPRMVYLTNAYATHYALAALTSDKDKVVVLEVDVDEDDLYPDEDFLEQATRNKDSAPCGSMEFRTRHFRNVLKDYQHHALDSLNCLGNVCHFGPIGREKWQRVAIIDNPIRLLGVFDPTITLLNYHFVGEWYRKGMKWLFGDEPKLDSITMTPGMELEFDRTGIQIEELNNA